PCPPSCQCYDVSKVFCSEERMQEIPAGLPGNATQLFFVEMALSSLRRGALGSSTTLTKLVFLNNNIQVLEAGTFQGLSNLTELEVSGNLALSFVSPGFLAGLPKLSKLSLGSNAIRSLKPGIFGAVGSLQDLRLRRNKIEVLPTEIFHPLRHLQLLDLSQNIMTELPPGLFSPLTSLRVLKLSDNLLAGLPSSAFSSLGHLLENIPHGLLDPLERLSSLYLSGNPWRCDCNLFYLHSWIQGNTEKV
ncbi:CPN2 Carboxypeptidase, partial [Nothocercus nigrocapillus]|nr:CPN2 Carboxypeptidase [Nothocercus nigrocapillus]